ncbi:MAG: rRNA maturation RNase YbeY [Candidatus Nealsonbacteria bacterium RIFOXYC1_FULL_40_7]|uniref:Endoribonuclease YbeY n=1 Tax=Candidatus Nealsonbacteria bacterium RIFOXYC1_FULL_40_7 TaxID=1801678 RepID=A0A1G2ES52_9BACT|nr:MAG: rRNA maturation RNase YbeY [Candidatus Nealsonbacteria bacterium RIFOXYC1_FULL_40_7]
MIEIRNFTRFKLDKKLLTGLAKKVLKRENRVSESLSIVFLGERKMKDLNKNCRGKEGPTDVLSFGDGLNEIAICPSVVKKNAEREGISFKKELSLVLAHGILHILGYSHGQEMFKKQNNYLKWQNRT